MINRSKMGKSVLGDQPADANPTQDTGQHHEGRQEAPDRELKTTYDEFLEKLRRDHNVTVKAAIWRLYELLKAEDPNLSTDDMYDRIMKDCLTIWKREWIQRNMPGDLKDEERQKSGQKGGLKKKEVVSVTSDGSVAVVTTANDSPEPPTEPISSSFEKPVDPEVEKRSIYEDSRSANVSNNVEEDLRQVDTMLQNLQNLKSQKEELETRNKQLESDKEELQLTNDKITEEMKDQKERFEELVKSTNLAMQSSKNKEVRESLEYKALEAQNYELTQRVNELEQLERKRMKEHPEQSFQNAETIEATTTAQGQKLNGEVEFPTKDLSAFFMDQRLAKYVIYLTIKDGRVIAWESDAKRKGTQC